MAAAARVEQSPATSTADNSGEVSDASALLRAAAGRMLAATAARPATSLWEASGGGSFSPPQHSSDTQVPDACPLSSPSWPGAPTAPRQQRASNPPPSRGSTFPGYEVLLHLTPPLMLRRARSEPACSRAAGAWPPIAPVLLAASIAAIAPLATPAPQAPLTPAPAPSSLLSQLESQIEALQLRAGPLPMTRSTALARRSDSSIVRPGDVAQRAYRAHLSREAALWGRSALGALGAHAPVSRLEHNTDSSQSSFVSEWSSCSVSKTRDIQQLVGRELRDGGLGNLPTAFGPPSYTRQPRLLSPLPETLLVSQDGVAAASAPSSPALPRVRTEAAPCESGGARSHLADVRGAWRSFSALHGHAEAPSAPRGGLNASFGSGPLHDYSEAAASAAPATDAATLQSLDHLPFSDILAHFYDSYDSSAPPPLAPWAVSPRADSARFSDAEQLDHVSVSAVALAAAAGSPLSPYQRSITGPDSSHSTASVGDMLAAIVPWHWCPLSAQSLSAQSSSASVLPEPDQADRLNRAVINSVRASGTVSALRRLGQRFQRRGAGAPRSLSGAEHASAFEPPSSSR